MNKKLALIPASLAAVGIVVLATQISPPTAPHQQLSCERVAPVTQVVPSVTPRPLPPKPAPVPMRPTMPRPQSSD